MLKQAQAITPELIRLRRHIHQNPELGFEEYQTAALVADTLREIGLDVQEKIGRTGVVAQIGTGAGPTIGIRADMDALPIKENTSHGFGSKNEGVMHACGHDAHTAILLGVAHLLQDNFANNKWNGNVRLLFQPAEEMSDSDGISGATAMITDNALDGVDAVIALHVWSERPVGVCYFQDGFSHAASDAFEGWITASGGHGAYPHAAGDPIYMLNHVLNRLYAIPSRVIDPLQPAVVSIGQVHAGTASNIIPNEAYIEGTMRSFDPDVRQQLRDEVEQALKMVETYGGQCRYKLTPGYRSLWNDKGITERLRESARSIVDDGNVQDIRFGMGAEDFAYMAQEARGAMFMLGAAIPDGITRPHHTGVFDIDERCLPIGAAVLAETARRFVASE